MKRSVVFSILFLIAVLIVPRSNVFAQIGDTLSVTVSPILVKQTGSIYTFTSNINDPEGKPLEITFLIDNRQLDVDKTTSATTEYSFEWDSSSATVGKHTAKITVGGEINKDAYVEKSQEQDFMTKASPTSPPKTGAPVSPPQSLGGPQNGSPTAELGGPQNGSSEGGLLNPLKGKGDLGSFLTSILALVVKFGAIVVVLMLVFVGFKFVTAQGVPGEIEKARTMLLWTIIGGLILLGAQGISLGIQATANAL